MKNHVFCEYVNCYGRHCRSISALYRDVPVDTEEESRKSHGGPWLIGGSWVKRTNLCKKHADKMAPEAVNA
jgi:hypothetical protein